MFYHSMRYEYVQLARKCKLTVHIGGSFKPTPKVLVCMELNDRQCNYTERPTSQNLKGRDI